VCVCVCVCVCVNKGFPSREKTFNNDMEVGNSTMWVKNFQQGNNILIKEYLLWLLIVLEIEGGVNFLLFLFFKNLTYINFVL
jgi:hypothetical protein